MAAVAGTVLAAPADDLREAQGLFDQGKFEASLDKLDAYLKSQPREAQGRFLRGLILTEQKKVDEAIDVFTRLTEEFPELPEPYNNLAVLFASRGEYDKARAALELSVGTRPNYATAHENLGDIHLRLALRAYERAQQFDGANAATKARIARLRELLAGRAPEGKAGTVTTPPEADTARKRP